ncbi:hypothetical protein U8P68_16185 [Rhizobium ruizarguesonis]|nr:hypothetical protein U8Q07_16225 [Rhizobium ruizarguesonis]WSH56410.1 hypothetical protein U8P68_16185 [Rhizobium ruizarguesonis]
MQLESEITAATEIKYIKIFCTINPQLLLELILGSSQDSIRVQSLDPAIFLLANIGEVQS